MTSDAMTPPTSSPDPTDSALDPRALAQIRALQRPGQPNILGKIIKLYFANSQTLLQQIREAVATGDNEMLHRAAHSLKSISAQVGATNVVARCRELEQRGQERRLEDTPALLQELDHHYARTREALTIEQARLA